MKISRNEYNVPQIEVGAVTASTKTKVGTKADFDKIAAMIERSGIMIVGITLSGNAMRGSVLANHYEDDNANGIDFGGVTNYGYSPSIISGSLELESNGCYVTIAVTPVSASKSTKSKAE